MGAAGDLLRLTGGYIPFTKTKKNRMSTGDKRLSIKERYKNFQTYLVAYEEATLELFKKGYLLEEELPGIKALAKKNSQLIE